MNPYVFIVGCPRSGTTLLTRIASAHPLMAIVHELHWVPQFFERRLGITAEGLITREIMTTLLKHDKFHKLKVDQEDLEQLLSSGEPMSYARFVTSIFDLYGERKGKRFVGEKTPNYAQHIPTLHTLWPRAKFVHLIRDGRDVHLSVKTWKTREGVDQMARLAKRFPSWDKDPTGATALFWEWHVRLGRESGAALGRDLYHEIRYESLVAEPEAECAALCAFLALPYDDAMLRFHEGRERTDPGLSAKRAWLPPTHGLRDWRTQMAAEDVVRFEAVAGDMLDELGYERARPPPAGEHIARARRHRAAFERELRERGSAVPEAWESASV